MLHSLDQWYINPREYEHPPFHTENLNSLDVASIEMLSKEQLQEYLQSIKAKITDYLNSLDDEMLYEVPNGCKQNRPGLILSQFRHFYANLGNINATTIVIKNTDGVKVGYVPREDNVIFSRLMDAGKLLFGKITHKEMKGKWLNIKIKIYLHE